MARESREVWAKRVERWQYSGLTQQEFAAELGIEMQGKAHEILGIALPIKPPKTN